MRGLSLKALAMSVILVSNSGLIFPNAYANEKVAHWPAVSPVHRMYEFNDASHAAIPKLTIKSINGKPLYDISCYTEWDFPGNYDYSGIFMCRMLPLYKSPLDDNSLAQSNLFYGPNPIAQWDTRSRFLINQLIGECGTYPEYGRVRHFRFRGMKITLKISNLNFEEEKGAASNKFFLLKLHDFEFTIDVKSEPNVTNNFAATTEYKAPKLIQDNRSSGFIYDCSKIRRASSVDKKKSTKVFSSIDFNKKAILKSDELNAEMKTASEMKTNQRSAPCYNGKVRDFEGMLTAGEFRKESNGEKGKSEPILVLHLKKPINVCMEYDDITDLSVSIWDLDLLNALSTEYVGRNVVVHGSLISNDLPQYLKLPFTVNNIDGICLINNGEQRRCRRN